MAAYILFDVEVHDPDMYEAYKKLTPDTVAAFGGKFLVRGGATSIPEGDWQPGRIVMLEFPDRASAEAWWHSEAYTRARAIRQRSAHARMLIVDGL